MPVGMIQSRFGFIHAVAVLLLSLNCIYAFTSTTPSTTTTSTFQLAFQRTGTTVLGRTIPPQPTCTTNSLLDRHSSSSSLLSLSSSSTSSRRFLPYNCRYHRHQPSSSGHYAVTKEKESTTTTTDVTVKDVIKDVNGVPVPNGELPVDGINGEDGTEVTNGQKSSKVPSATKGKSTTTTATTMTTTLSDFNSSHVSDLLDEINKRITDGSTELIQNITTVVDEQMPQLNDTAAQEFSEYLGDLAIKLQKAQQDEIERQLVELEKLFLAPIERVAFSDAPLFEMNQNSKALNDTLTEVRAENRELILTGENSTLRSSSKLGTKELIRNLNVAPLYYSVALLYRWFQKASYPSIYLLSAYKGLANVVKSRGGPRRRWRRKRKKADSEEISYEEYIKEAEAFQTGWKRTGEIAAKGPWARKWAILRRSAEIWAYFSSFYLKDRRICNKYNSGRWSEEKFKAERSKLGAEITQNLLRLGPTFIKVRILSDGEITETFSFLSCHLPFTTASYTLIFLNSHHRSANYSQQGLILFLRNILIS